MAMAYLEHDLRHLLSVSLGVQGGLGQQHGMLFRGHTELIVKGVMPYLLHVIPVGDDAVLDGVLEGQDTTLGLRFVADVRILLAHAHHDTLVTGAAWQRGGEGSGRGGGAGEEGRQGVGRM